MLPIPEDVLARFNEVLIKRASPILPHTATIGNVFDILSIIAKNTHPPKLDPSESDYSLRTVFHGKCGELRQRYRDGQEDQFGTLGLVIATIEPIATDIYCKT